MSGFYYYMFKILQQEDLIMILKAKLNTNNPSEWLKSYHYIKSNKPDNSWWMADKQIKT